MFKLYKFNRIFLCFIAFLLTQSCVPDLPKGQNISKGKLEIPNQFPNYTLHKASLQNKESEVEADNWKVFFKDEQLISLIEIALKNNQEINILDQEINIANNEILARKGEYLPKVGIGAGYEYEKTSEFTSRGANDLSSGVPSKLHNRQLGLSASWEIDSWNKLHNFAKSAYYKYLASIEGRNFAVTQLVAEIANDYYELMALDNRLETINKYIKTLQKAQQVVEFQRVAGRATSLAVKRYAAEVIKNKSHRYEIRQQITITENHLNSLLGRWPQKIKRDSNKFTEIELKEVKIGLPSRLIDNRPDIKQASLELQAEKLNVKAVKAQFYPSLVIDSSLGYQSFNSAHFLDSPSALFYNVAGKITAPLLNRKGIKADYFSANSKQIQAIYNYEQTFIKAFAEVSNQLSSVENLKKIHELKLKQMTALSESVNISNTLFRAARIDYLESLLTQRDYLEARIELIEVKKQQLTTHINLYRALGGGWK